MAYTINKNAARFGRTTERILKTLSTLGLVASVIALIWANRSWAEFLQEQFGFRSVPVDISGTGSMAPTFPVGQGATLEARSTEVVDTLGMYRFPGGIRWQNWQVGEKKLGWGDLVFVRDTKNGNVVGSKGVMKRVIGLPGDKIELRDGFVWRNGEQLIEPYTLQPRSTFGGPHLNECQATTIPADHIFILGDNRKRSDDSRFRLGMVSISDVDRYFPWQQQSALFSSRWRSDTSGDAALAGQPTFDATGFVSGLNQLRSQAGQKKLQAQATLSRVAQRRAEAWLNPGQVSTDAATLINAAQNQGYRNPLLAELPVSGFYSDQEFLESIESIEAWQDILMRPDYQDVGVGVAVTQESCPRQSVVIMLGGYVPADYDSNMLTSWRDALTALRTVRPGWIGLEQASQALTEEQKRELFELVEIIDTRINRTESIVRVMERREWLSDEQTKWLEEDATLAQKQYQLSQKLNSR